MAFEGSPATPGHAMTVDDTLRIDFIVPGFSKCGTTSLCELLSWHSSLFMPRGELKEPAYFIRDDLAGHWQAYRDLFQAATPGQLLGEGSTFYSCSNVEELARDRILEHNPDIKLIFIARDPIKRIESSFREFHHSGHRFGVDIPYDFPEALETVPALTEDSMFWTRLNCYRSRLPDSRILIVFMEDLVVSPTDVLMRCHEFLGVAPENPPQAVRMNEGGSKLYDTAALRRLRAAPFFAPRIARMSHRKQDRIFSALGLRRRFVQPPAWTDRAREFVHARLSADIARFLAHTGRDPAIWPHFRALQEQLSPRATGAS